MVPVIHENDTTTTDEISFGDNAFLPPRWRPARATRGLLNARGSLHRDPARPIGLAQPRSAARELDLYDSALDLALVGAACAPRLGGGYGHRCGIPVWPRAAPTAPAGGRAPGAHRTAFHPQRGWFRASTLLKYAKPTPPVVVDEGAERALRERGTSLLPVGVVGVEGEFDAGDAVEVTCNGRTVGKGIVGYSSGELRRIKGLKTDAVRELMPRATEEAVHRDYFVLD